MHGICFFCGSWKAQEQESCYGSCSHQNVGQLAKPNPYETAALLLQGLPAGASFYVGMNFGCVHFHAREKPRIDPTKKMRLITPDDLRRILKRNNMRQVDLARKLNVTPQRVSDWMANRCKVPSLAVAAIEAMELL
jgi:predicted XRE-type DNA-binding protein